MTNDIAPPINLPELRKAVRILEEFVQEDEPKSNLKIIKALDTYTNACMTVNDRLAECNRLLRLGQRSEALRQLQMEPDALDVYKILYFKNLDWLAEDCKICDLPTPPRLDNEAANSLNEAYSLEQNQAALLREHRLLALSRAPLKRRLDVLRLVQKEAPREAFWQDDIVSYEEKRFDEIREMMKQIAESKNQVEWPIIQELHAEASAHANWSTPYPLDLKDQIRTIRAGLQQKAAQQRLSRLFDGMRKAMQQHNVNQVKTLISQAKNVQNRYELDPDGPVMEPLVDAEQWVRQQKKIKGDWGKFQADVENLRNALRDGVEWYYVQQYYAFALQHGWSLPEDIAEEFRRKAEARKMYYIIGAVVCLAVVSIGLILFLINRI